MKTLVLHGEFFKAWYDVSLYLVIFQNLKEKSGFSLNKKFILQKFHLSITEFVYILSINHLSFVLRKSNYIPYGHKVLNFLVIKIKILQLFVAWRKFVPSKLYGTIVVTGKIPMMNGPYYAP